MQININAAGNGIIQQGGELLFALQRIISFNEKKEIDCCGVTMTQALTLLAFQGTTSLLMRELADTLKVKQSTMTRIVDPLVRDGLLVRAVDSHDRRAVRVKLTKRGEATVIKLTRCYGDFWQRIFTRIPADKRKTVIASLEILIDVLAGMETDSCCSVK